MRPEFGKTDRSTKGPLISFGVAFLVLITTPAVVLVARLSPGGTAVRAHRHRVELHRNDANVADMSAYIGGDLMAPFTVLCLAIGLVSGH